MVKYYPQMMVLNEVSMTITVPCKGNKIRQAFCLSQGMTRLEATVDRYFVGAAKSISRPIRIFLSIA